MQRYSEFSDGEININGKRRYRTLFYPDFPYKSSDIFLYINSTHRLDNLAYNYYGDPRFWIVIARANNLNAATIRPPIGMRIRVPYPLEYDNLAQLFDEANEND